MRISFLMSSFKIQGGGDSPPGGTSERRHHGRKSLLQRVPQGLHCTMGKLKKNGSKIVKLFLHQFSTKIHQTWRDGVKPSKKSRK